jgi:hypothetical protein
MTVLHLLRVLTGPQRASMSQWGSRFEGVKNRQYILIDMQHTCKIVTYSVIPTGSVSDHYPIFLVASPVDTEGLEGELFSSTQLCEIVDYISTI